MSGLTVLRWWARLDLNQSQWLPKPQGCQATPRALNFDVIDDGYALLSFIRLLLELDFRLFWSLQLERLRKVAQYDDIVQILHPAEGDLDTGAVRDQSRVCAGDVETVDAVTSGVKSYVVDRTKVGPVAGVDRQPKQSRGDVKHGLRLQAGLRRFVPQHIYMGCGCRGSMGQVRPTYIKRIAIELVKNHGDRFTEDFDHNKTQVTELTDVKSISMRNRITGYVTRYRKQEQA